MYLQWCTSLSILLLAPCFNDPRYWSKVPSCLAFNGGSHIFSLPVLPYFSLLAFFVSSHSPPPINCPRPLCSARLVKRVCDQRRNKWRRTGWLRCLFLFSHCTPQWSIVWGLHFFFSSLSSCNAVIFFNSLSSCPVYPLVCMGKLMAYFTGTCD